MQTHVEVKFISILHYMVSKKVPVNFAKRFLEWPSDNTIICKHNVQLPMF